MYLVGDFNNWDTKATPCTKRRDGVFEVFLPDQHGEYPSSFNIHKTFYSSPFQSQGQNDCI